jgi:hypothetical protein
LEMRLLAAVLQRKQSKSNSNIVTVQLQFTVDNSSIYYWRLWRQKI